MVIYILSDPEPVLRSSPICIDQRQKIGMHRTVSLFTSGFPAFHEGLAFTVYPALIELRYVLI